MRLALPLALVAIVLNSGFVSTTSIEDVAESKCSWDAANWCNNLSNAKDCQKIGYCIESVWEQRPVPEDTNAICGTCKDMIRKARNRLPCDNAETELHEMFGESCELLPTNQLKEACNTQTSNSLPELLQVLDSQMSHEQVCTVLDLCNSAKLQNMLMQSYLVALEGSLNENDVEPKEKDMVDQPDQLSCTTCNLLTLALKEQFVSTKREDLIENMLHGCYSLHSLSDTCANIVFNYFDDVYELAKQHLLSNDICHVVNICAHQVEPFEPAAVATLAIRSDKFYCDQCKQMVQHMRDSLVKNTSEAEFKHKLMDYCKSMRGFKSQCARVVDQFYHVMYSLLKSQLDPDAVCTFVNACKRHQKVEETALELNAANDNNELEAVGRETAKCHLCKRVMRALKRSVKRHQDIKVAMERVCHLLKNRHQQIECQSMLKQHAEGITDLIKKNATCPEICRAINVCLLFEDLFVFDEQVDDEFESDVTLPEEENDQTELSVDGDLTRGPKCALCKAAMKVMQKLVRNRADRGSITRAMSQVCSHMKKLRGACNRMVQRHGNKIVDLMTKKTGGNAICKMIGVCRSKLDLEADSETLDEEQSVNFESFEINDDLFPLETPLTDEDLQGSGRCTACKTAINTLRRMVHHHEDRGAITKAMGEVCHKLGKLHSICDRVVREHGNQIVDMMVKHMSADGICKAIHVCRLTASDEDTSVAETALDDLNIQAEGLELSQPKEAPLCIFCELFVSKLKGTVSTKAQRDFVIKEVLNSCQRLPHAFREPCHSIAVQYGNFVLDLLAKVTPQEFCRFAHFCFSKAEYDELIRNMELFSSAATEQDSLENLNQGPFCLICELLVSRFERLLNTKEKRDRILNVFQFFCNYLPIIHEPCHNILNAFGPGVLDLLSKVNPHDVCGILPLCVAQNVNVSDVDNSL